MKILFITDLYPVKDSEKTTPRTHSNFVADWKEAGHEVDVIKPNFILNSFLRGKPFYKNGYYDDVLNLNYITPFWLDVKKKFPKNLSSRLKDYDVTIAHMPSGILFADKLGLPFVAGIHNSDLTVLTGPLYRFHFKKRMEKALENSKAIACRSFALKEKFLKLYPQFKEKTFAAPSGINERVINHSPLPPIPQGAMEKNTPLKILTCANYKRRKNIEELLKATNGLEGIELTVIGQGTDTKKLQKLNPKAIFKGYQPREKVLDFMRKSDVFILPSISETFGMVYLEAMAAGCVTVCAKGDGIDGIIENTKNGFTVEPSVNKIRTLLLDIKNLDNESLKLLQHNSFETIKQYTGKVCAQNYLQQIFKIM